MYLRRRFSLATGLVSLAIFCVPVSSSASVPAPDQLGPFGVGRTTFVFHDQSRNRTLVTNVWYPTQATTGPFARYRVRAPIIGVDVMLTSETAREGVPVASGLFGLILFSHAGFGFATQSFFLTEALASHGFVVVAPDHLGNTLQDIGQPTQETEIFKAVSDRPRDISFLITKMLALNTNPSSQFFARINPFRIGVTGHSAGGLTAFMMAAGFSGEGLVQLGLPPPPGFMPVPPDNRVRAIIPVSIGVDPRVTAEELSAIDVSTLLITGTTDEAVPLATVRAAFDLIGADRVMESDLVNAFHLSPTNVCEINEAIAAAGQTPLSAIFGNQSELPCGPTALPVEEAHRLTNLYEVAFSRYVLNFEIPYLCFLTEEYAASNEPNIQFQRKPFFVDDVLALANCN